jgi:hypothetical protein
MIDAKFPKSINLAELARRLNEYEPLYGALAGLGNAENKTIGSFDDGKEGTGGLILKPSVGDPGGEPGFVCEGRVYVNGNLQQVKALRR